jgi:hypothetical protein
VKSASGAGALERVQSEMGSQVGITDEGSANKCRDLITTLGEGARGSIITLGEGALLKSSRWGVAWKQRVIGAGDAIVEAAGRGGGLQAETGNRGQRGVGSTGEHTLGGSWGGTLGWAGRVGSAWAERPVVWSGARIQDILKVGNGVHQGDTCGRCRSCK